MVRNLSDEELINFLKNDKIGRNAFLNSLLRVILSSSNGIILDLDGKWGSGKTVVAKELSLINESSESYDNLDDELLGKYRDDYSVFYYNAWENDQYDPSESIVFQLINQYWGKQEKIADKVLSLIPPFISRAATEVVGCEIPKIENGYTKGLFEDVKNRNKRKQAASDIISNALEKSKKKQMLIIIDELDRCNPIFAVKLLEVIKHYFSDVAAKILFITNNCQLSGIVEKYYGDKTSGYEYLDKIFDLIIEIPEISISDYINIYGDIEGQDTREMVVEVAKYYKMSVREVERLILLFKMSTQYLKSGTLHTRCGFNPYKYFAKCFLIPFILGAKIKSIDDFVALVSWGADGADVVKKICSGSSYAKEIIRRCNSSANMAVRAESLYSQFISQDGKIDGETEMEVKKLIIDMVSLTGILSDNISL